MFPGLGIEVMVVAVNGGQVKLGIEAPKEIVVHREEVAKRQDRAARATSLMSSIPSLVPASAY